MAEGILKSILKAKGIDNILVSSAGTGGLDRFPASTFAVEATKHWDVDITGHYSRRLEPAMAREADLILAMAPEHVEYILEKAPEVRKKTYLLKGYPRPYSPLQERVNDPMGGPLEYYNQIYLELDEILRRIDGDIIKMAESSGS